MYNRIELPLQPSTGAGLVAAGPWLVLAVIVTGLAWSPAGPFALILLPLLLSGAFDRWRRCGSQQHPQAVVRLITRGPRLFATLKDTTVVEVEPTADSRVTGHYLILALRQRPGRQRYPVVALAANAADPGALRRLRVWLRLMPPAPAPIDSPPWYQIPMQRPRPGGKHHEH